MSEGAPSCVLFLVQASKGMDRARLCAARLHIDQALDLLLRHAPTVAQAKQVRVGIFGYASGRGRVRLTPLLAGTNSEKPFARLSTLARGPRRQVRIDRLKPAGKARVAEGLAAAHGLLQKWLSEHPGAKPPVVLHWGDGQGCGFAHRRVSHSLCLLGTPAGETGLAHIVLAPDRTVRAVGERKPGMPVSWRRVWKQSSPVLLRGKKLGRALAVNRDPLSLLRRLLAQNRTLHVQEPTGIHARLRVLTLVKQGNSEGEFEDAHALAPADNTAVVSDGASEGIFVATWARLLSTAYLSERPDLENLEQLAVWLAARRHAWMEAIDYPKLRWSQQGKVDAVGAGATFIGWQLRATADGEPAWKAWAVGDSCLFWVRKNRLRASFPLTHSRQFGQAPALFATRSDLPLPAPLSAAGRCRLGDLFVLATDAVAQYLLRAVEQKQEPDWNALEGIAEDDWRKRIEELRAGQRMVNDDCTLVFARVEKT